MPRNLSELSAEQAEALAEQAAGKLGYKLLRVGKDWTFRHESWRPGVFGSRHPTKLGALTAIIRRMGTKERR